VHNGAPEVHIDRSTVNVQVSVNVQVTEKMHIDLVEKKSEFQMTVSRQG
jgi:hypothetical protein